MAFALLVAVALVAQLATAAALAVLHPDAIREALREPGALGPALLALLTQGPALVVSLAITCLCVLGSALAAARLTGPSVRARLRWTPSSLGALDYALALVGVLALGQALEGIAAHVDVPSASLEAIGGAAAHSSPPLFAVLFLFGTLGAGVGEESFFRGYMGSVLGERWPRWANITTTAACFGALHGDPVHSPLAFCLGLYLGWLAERAGSIRPTMAIHALNNAVSFLQARFGSPLEAATPSPLMIAFALLVMGGSIAALRARSTPAAAPGLSST